MTFEPSSDALPAQTDDRPTDAARRPRRFWSALRTATRVARVVLLVFLVALLVFSVWLTSALKRFHYVEPWDEAVDGERIEKLVYGPKPWNTLDLYIPKNLPDAPTQNLVLFIHGGAWVVGTQREESGPCRRTAKQGYITATINYMLYRKNREAEYSLDALMSEIDAALAKIKTETEARGLKIGRIGISGLSAGAHLAMLYAYSRRETSPFNVAFVAPRVGPADFNLDSWPNLKPERVAQIVSKLTQTEISVAEMRDGSAKAQIERVSPTYWVDAGKAIPTLAAYAGKDCLVPRPQGEKMRAALEKSGVPFDFLFFANSSHVLLGDSALTDEYERLLFEYAQKYLRDADAAESPTEARSN